MGRQKHQRGQAAKTDVALYPIVPINGAVGALRLSNEQIARKAKLNPKSVGAVRNGASVSVATLSAVLNVLGLALAIQPKPETATDGSRTAATV